MFSFVIEIYEIEPKIIELRKIESQRKLELENTTKQLNDLKNELEEQKTKLNAQKIRNKNLQDEIASHKMKIKNLMEKSEHDDNYLKLLSVC